MLRSFTGILLLQMGVDVLMGPAHRPLQRATRALRGTINRDVRIWLPALHDHGGETTHVDLEMALPVESRSRAVYVRQVHSHPLYSSLESSQGELDSAFHVFPQAGSRAEAPGLNVHFHGAGPLESMF